MGMPATSPIEYITAPENNSFQIGIQNYQTEFAQDIIEDKPLQYKLGEDFISFKPIEMRWNKKTFKTIKSSLKQNKKYVEIFGQGIDLEIQEGDRIWSKIIKINSLTDLEAIPNKGFLEIKFEVETNMIIDGWNKKDDFEITETIRLGDYSYLEPAYVWDSWTSTTCEIIDEIEDCEVLTNRIQIKSYFSENKGKLYYIKEIPIDWIRTALFPIYTDADITYGTASEFNGGETRLVRVTAVDDDKIVVCYGDVTNWDGKCIAGTVSGTSTLSWGTESQFEPSWVHNQTAWDLGVCKLDTDKFVVIYVDDTDDDGYARVGTITGTVINDWGATNEFESGDTLFPACSPFGTDKFVVCYDDETDAHDAKCVVATISDNTITDGAPAEFSEWILFMHQPVMAATDRFVNCSFQDGNNLLYCIVGNVTGLNVEYGTYYTTSSAATMPSRDLDIIALEDNKLVFVHKVAYPISDPVLGIMTISGTSTISAKFVTVLTDYTTAAENFSIVKIDSTHFVVVGSKGSVGPGYSNYCTVDFGAETITCSGTINFTSNDPGGYTDKAIDAAYVSSDRIVICYQDDTDSDKGKCIIGNTPAAEEEGVLPPPPPPPIFFE